MRPRPRVGHGETVLVVDDEPTIRRLIARCWRIWVTPIEVRTGRRLKVLQSTRRIDLLTRCRSGGRIERSPGRRRPAAVRPDLKVLFVTGYAENAVIGNGHLEPGMQIMTKPFALEALGEKIREVIVTARAASSA